MPSTKRNFYEILGIPKTANQQEIRRRYRELVRIYHPDVHPDKELSHRVMIDLVEAYRVLGNVSSRAEYDRRLEREAAEARRATWTPPPPPPPSSSNSATAEPQQGRRRRPSITETDRLISNARLDFLAGNLRASMVTCRRVIQMDPRNAIAHMILGDVYRAMGRGDEAMSMYTLAVQFDPRNPEIRQRMERLMKDEQAAATQASSPRAAYRAELLRFAVWSFGAALIMGALLLLSMFPGKPEWMEVRLISEWTGNIIGVLALISVILGALLSITHSVRRADEELVFATIRTLPGRSRQSFGITILILSLIWFYLGLISYILLSANNETISTSVLKAYAAALVAVALVALTMPLAAGQLFLLGANISYAFVLIGWALGDIFRPPG